MDVYWLLFMWHSSLLTFQPVNFSLIIYLTEIWHHTLTIPTVSSLQSKLHEAKNEANNKVMEEVRNLSDTITKLSSEVSITNNVNILLSIKLVTLERQYWANAQYSRRECLDILSILVKLVEKYRRRRCWIFLTK